MEFGVIGTVLMILEIGKLKAFGSTPGSTPGCTPPSSELVLSDISPPPNFQAYSNKPP